MNSINSFQEHVDMKFQLYNGLFLNLPFEDVRTSGLLLPVFTQYAKQELEKGAAPKEIVLQFFRERLGIEDEQVIVDDLFRFMRLVERQVVLFDALEDAAFSQIHDIQGPGCVKDVLNRIEREERIEDYEAFINDYRVRIVLTAHPTQFYTDEVLTILTDLAKSLESNDIRSINELLLQMGQTRFKNREKPTPLEEAEGLMWILEHVMYQVVPDIHQRLVTRVCRDTEAAIRLPGRIELGFWPGGDRDGNPYVTSDLTKEVGELLRSSIIQLYLHDVRSLRRRLTFPGVIELMDSIEERLEHTLYPFSRVPKKASDGTFCVELEDRGYRSSQELVEDLLTIRKLVNQEHRGLFVDRVERLICTVQSFGFHFATLDIRQDSRVHGDFMETAMKIIGKNGITGHEDYLSLGETERFTLLENTIQDMRSLPREQRLSLGREITSELADHDNQILRDILGSVEALEEIQSRNGEIGCHRYIISNTQSAANVLEVMVIALLGGLDTQNLPLDIVPLFETIDDLHAAQSVMEQLYTAPVYTSHLINRRENQTIMLGFSDGTKDGGYVAANWEIYQAKERLTLVSKNKGYRVQFFDGRGGPPARGGGNTHKFYRSLGPEIDSRAIQLTIQGQTISSLYGTPESATYNLEQIVSAGIENNLFPGDYSTMSTSERGDLQELSIAAREAYLELRNHPSFVPYLEQMTPLQYYGKTNIGSRPAKRKSNRSLRLEDLRAIPFVGAWSQMKQNVPGFYGFGRALNVLSTPERTQAFQRLYQGNLFFRTLVENSMQSLSKSYFALTRYHREDPQFGEFWNLLNDEAERTMKKLLTISGQTSLLETDPSIRQSIALRENLILPSQVIQQYALTRLRELEKNQGMAGHSNHPVKETTIPNQETFEKLVIKSMAASINASRNAV